jgi:outer membrane protein assembly factor BamA
MISKRFLAVFLIAGAVAIFAPLAAQENSNPVSPAPSSSARQIIRRFAIRCFDGNETTNCAQIEQKLSDEGHLGLIDQPYDQTKVDAIMMEIRDFYKDKGIAVDVESDTKPAPRGHAVLVTIQINKA